MRYFSKINEFQGRRLEVRGWYHDLLLIYAHANHTHGLWPAREPVQKLCGAVLRWSPSSRRIFCTSVRRICIANDVWWADRHRQKTTETAGSPAPSEHSGGGGGGGSRLNTHWHSAVTPHAPLTGIKARVGTIICQFSSCVLRETHQLLKGTFCSSYRSSRGLCFL